MPYRVAKANESWEYPAIDLECLNPARDLDAGA